MSVESARCGLLTSEGRPIPLLGVEIRGEVYGSYAHLVVRQRYVNAEPKPIEAVYTFPLPSTATLSGFAMTCAGRTLEGMVVEREEAFRRYDEAVSSGHGAALLDQERVNVFTAQVGNLLPGEETIVEVVTLQRLEAEEGSLRLALPTLVAPRYVPGQSAGARTAGGWAEPTDRVPDADRITPRPARDVAYGLALDLVLDLGRPLRVESPSHALVVVAEEANRHRASFAGAEVPLDRDVVLVISAAESPSAEPVAAPFTVVAAHRADPALEVGHEATHEATHESTPEGGAGAAQRPHEGTFALTIVPDLLGVPESTGQPLAARHDAPGHEVVFLIDVSSSMGGMSLVQAISALRLCLRHLRAGDRFNVLAFADDLTSFRPSPVPFDEESLAAADDFVARLQAHGGTELLAPVTAAVEQAPDGVIVLLTDGQVGNEDEILAAVLQRRGRARVYSFGIGTNVSDALLTGLARQTGGGVEGIYPGERIEEKVVAQFARATAERVDDLRLDWQGVEVSELAPGEPPALVDGEPWTVLARYAKPGAGAVTLRGSRRGEPWSLTVPLDLPVRAERPHLVKLWAAERVRDLLAAQLVGRRADAMRERIVALAVEHGLATPYTSFVVVETRSGQRRASGQPETRFVPVHVPYGWAMFQPAAQTVVAQPPPPATQPATGVTRTSPRSAAASLAGPAAARGFFAKLLGRAAATTPPEFLAAPAFSPVPEPLPEAVSDAMFAARRRALVSSDPVVALLSRQLASGLWDATEAAGREDGRRDGDEVVRQVDATVEALTTLEAAGVTVRHRLHGAQVKKAVEAVLAALAREGSAPPPLVAAALAVAWRLATPRLRQRVEQAAALVAPSLTFAERSA